jgi:hypothetical protein
MVKRDTRPRGLGQYHIQYCEPSDVWPRGGWSIYRITGDEIAKKIIWERYNTDRGWPTGKVKFRHSWTGYLGMVETFAELQELIDKDASELVTYVTYKDAS